MVSLRGWCNAALGAVLFLVTAAANAQQWVGTCPANTRPILTVSSTGKGGTFSGSFNATTCAIGTVYTSPEAFQASCLKSGSPGFSNGATAYDTWSTPPAFTTTSTYSSQNTGPAIQQCAKPSAGAARCDLGFVNTSARYTCAACPSGQTPDPATGVCVAEPGQCAAGTLKATGVLRNADHSAQGLACIDGCRVNDATPGPRVTVGLLLVDTPTQQPSGLTAGRTDSQWKTTGALCDGTEPAPAAGAEAATVATRDGDTIQTGGSINPANCGTFNGEYVCVGSEPANGCVTTAGGQAFCSSTAPVPPTPRDPSNPTQAARPVGQVTVTRDGVTTVTNYYNVNQVIAGTNATTTGGTGGGSTGGTGGAGGTTGGTVGSTGGGTGGTCGAPGQPVCKVDIDETGTPESFDVESLPGSGDDPSQAAQTAANAFDEAIGSATAETEGRLNGLFGMARDMIPSGVDGGCQTIPYTVSMPFGAEINGSFPSAVGCDLFKVVQAILGWALAGFTLVTCLIRVRQTLSGAIV